MKQTNDMPPPRLLLTIPEVATALGLGRTTVQELLTEPGGIPTIRFGKAVRISLVSLKRWVEKREREQAAEPRKG